MLKTSGIVCDKHPHRLGLTDTLSRQNQNIVKMRNCCPIRLHRTVLSTFYNGQQRTRARETFCSRLNSPRLIPHKGHERCHKISSHTVFFSFHYFLAELSPIVRVPANELRKSLMGIIVANDKC